MTLPDISPEWYAILGAIGLFLGQQVWPWLRARFDQEYADRRSRERAIIDTAAQDAHTIAESLKALAASLDLLARTQVAQEMHIQRIEREQSEASQILRGIAPPLPRRKVRPVTEPLKTAEEPPA